MQLDQVLEGDAARARGSEAAREGTGGSRSRRPGSAGSMIESSQTWRLGEQLAEELLQIYCDSFDVAPEEVRILFEDDTIVVFLDELGLSANEQSLVDQGQADAVTAARLGYQCSLEPAFLAAVERVTGRWVVSVVSAARLDP